MGKLPTTSFYLLFILGIACIFLNVYGTQWSLPSELHHGIDFPSRPCYDSLNDNINNKTVVHLNETIPKIFHCGGYALNRNFQPVLESLMPEYEWQDLRQVVDWSSFPSHQFDVFVSNYQLNECADIGFHRWLQLQYKGKVIFWTPEDGTNLPTIEKRPHFYELGPGAPLVLTYLQTAYWAQLRREEKLKILDPTHRPKSAGQHFLIYAHSHCVGVRQAAFRQIANAGLPTAHFGGRCDGGVKKNQTKARAYPNRVRLANWEDNRDVYKDFRFCLTMEHVSTSGYITEKIMVAFWAGCIPVYWGTKEIFDIFNSKAFIFLDANNPRPAIERIRYLEQNQTAYSEVFQQPILAPGAFENYFSLHRNGFLKVRIRKYLGLDNFAFVTTRMKKI